jgi:hypothetical protein
MLLLVAGCVCAISEVGEHAAMAQYAAEVLSYTAGSAPSTGLTTPASALGSPERFTGDSGPFPFPSVVSPFSPPYLNDELVSIGEGGEITLRLSNFAIAQPAGMPEVGVFTNVGIADVNYPNGQAGNPAATFSGLDSAVVSVSADGISWFSLGSTLFDAPTNGYTDSGPYESSPSSALTDFQQPFTGGLSSFSGLSYAEMLTPLGGSGGGKWIDISPTGLVRVGYIRFTLATDGTSTNLNFDLDGVAVSHAALGGPTVPEPATIMLAATMLPRLPRSRPQRRLQRTDAARATA